MFRNQNNMEIHPTVAQILVITGHDPAQHSISMSHPFPSTHYHCPCVPCTIPQLPPDPDTIHGDKYCQYNHAVPEYPVDSEPTHAQRTLGLLTIVLDGVVDNKTCSQQYLKK